MVFAAFKTILMLIYLYDDNILDFLKFLAIFSSFKVITS